MSLREGSRTRQTRGRDGRPALTALAGLPMAMLATTLAAVLAFPAHAAGTAQPGSLPSMREPTAADRVLVVSPHPDDESLCCAGYIQRAVAAGAQVTIVWMTAGDGFELDAFVVERHLRLKGAGLERLGLQRMGEGRAAGQVLGLTPDQLIVLGYPDRGLSALLGDYYSRTYRSRYTLSATIPYATVLSPGSSYEGRNLERDLAMVIDRVQPTLVFAAAPEDLHSDHAISGVLALRLLAARGKSDVLHYWIVHAGESWPRPRGLHTELALLPPARAVARNWAQFVLTPAERQRKFEALQRHRSQMEVMPRFLEAYVRANEIFAH